jgi:hypothetical protein
VEENDLGMDPAKLKEYKDILKNNNSNVLTVDAKKQKIMVFNFKLPVKERSDADSDSELDGDAFST